MTEIKEGEYYTLKITPAQEGHYYANGDVVKVIGRYSSFGGWMVQTIPDGRVLHFALDAYNLSKANPLRVLATCADG